MKGASIRQITSPPRVCYGKHASLKCCHDTNKKCSGGKVCSSCIMYGSECIYAIAELCINPSGQDTDTGLNMPLCEFVLKQSCPWLPVRKLGTMNMDMTV